MSLENMYKDTVNVQRMQAEAAPNQDRSSWQTVITAMKCFIQPFDDDTREAGGSGAFFQGLKLFCDRSNVVKAGDRIVYGSVNYQVSDTKDHNYGNFPHLEVFMEQGDE